MVDLNEYTTPLAHRALDANIADAMKEMYFNTDKRTKLIENCEIRKTSFSKNL